MKNSKQSKSQQWVAPAAVGGVVGVGSALATMLLLSFAPPVSVAIGLALGAGSALMFTPLAPKPIAIAGRVAPTTVEESLSEVARSTDQLDLALSRLESRPLWHNSVLDEELHRLVDGTRSLARMPELRDRAVMDGAIQMLYTLATDYLPTIVNLAIENDRMHSTFSGQKSRQQVEQNIAELEPQADVLGEVLDRIETDIVRGTTHSVHEHAEFLKARFQEVGTESVLNLNNPMTPGTE
ncbi:hypothetical protein [Gulosibacter hominis]|uniref:hypothetical protein n=1 Tax=Gulosibacter hominis TaxID=2770504 RepID=UPI001917F05B|nr:hypothetical protein [Gulosibacter hominis]